MQCLLFALVQKFHRGDESDSKTPKEDEDLVTVLVLGSIVGREKYHCWVLARLMRSKMDGV